MKKKKLISYVLCLVLVFGLAACSKSEPTKSAPQTSGAAPAQSFSGTITFATGATTAAGLESALKSYQKTNPNVKIDTIITKTVTDFETMMTTWIASNTLPDMYIAQIGATEQGYAANGYLAPLTQYKFADRLVEGDKELMSYKGDIYAIPMALSPSVIFVNNAIAKKSGITLNNTNYPKNWKDFIDLCDKFVKAGVKYPIGIAGKDSSNITAWTFQYIYQVIYGTNPNWYADILNNGKNGAAWNDALYLGMFKKFDEMRPYMSEDVLGLDVNTITKRFVTGETPIFFQTAGSIADIRTIDPQADVIELPSCFTDDPTKQTLISGFDSGISITKNAKNKELCVDFLDYLTSVEGSTLFNDAAALLPTIVGSMAKRDPATDIIYDILDNHKLPNSPILSRQWIPGIKEVMKTNQQNWLAGQDAKECADNIQAEHDRLMKGNDKWVKEFLANYNTK